MVESVTLTIDGNEVTVDKGTSILEACRQNNTEVPHFCYHKRLSVAGNCRMCLVEVEGVPKPLASCATPVAPDMKVKTQGEMTVEARKGVMEFLLINHPLDCPICDQGGECDLQDIAVSYGSDRSSFHETKRAVHDINIGPMVKTVMTRCIHCTRCVRFATEVAGIEEMGATGRGENMQIGTYVEMALESELSGNMIDLCPVGALTSKPYAFVARPWELQRTDTIDVMDAVGSHIRVDHRGGKVMRIVPTECDELNEEWLSDTGRFSYDGLTRERLTSPMVRKGKNLELCSWPEAFAAIAKAAKKAKPAATAGLAGDMLSVEDLYSFNAFMKQVLKTDNVDARTDGSTITKGERGKYIFNSTLKGVDKADVILLVGSNPRLEAPVLNARIRKGVRQRGVKVAHLGAPTDLTYGVDELGSTPATLAALADGSHPFSKVLAKASRPMIIVGAQAILARADAAQIMHVLHQVAEKHNVVQPEWNGFNVLHQHVGRVAALDMGVHPVAKGMGTREILGALEQKKLDMLVLYGEGSLTPQHVQGADFTVFIGTHNSAFADLADVVLPAATYTEKNAWWTNTEGRVQAGTQVVLPPLNAKEDWKIFRALSEEIGKALPFDTQRQLRALIQEEVPYYATIGTVQAAPWKDFGIAGGIVDAPLEAPVTQFYRTNPVLRASAIMAEAQELADARAEARQKAMRKAG